MQCIETAVAGDGVSMTSSTAARLETLRVAHPTSSVAIVGPGLVGVTTAYALLLSGVVPEIVLGGCSHCHRLRWAWAKVDATPGELRTTLKRHASRAHLAEWSIAFLYTAVVFLVTTCISIAIDHETAHSLSWLPVGLAITGTSALLVGGH